MYSRRKTLNGSDSASWSTIREQSRKAGTDNAICVTNVVHGNTTALKLYNKLGFQVTDEDEVEGKEGRTYHTTQLKMQL
jgi:ribosomal protein S18 acetylase RimI-like enzyme